MRCTALVSAVFKRPSLDIENDSVEQAMWKQQTSSSQNSHTAAGALTYENPTHFAIYIEVHTYLIEPLILPLSMARRAKAIDGPIFNYIVHG